MLRNSHRDQGLNHDNAAANSRTPSFIFKITLMIATDLLLTILRAGDIEVNQARDYQDTHVVNAKRHAQITRVPKLVSCARNVIHGFMLSVCICLRKCFPAWLGQTYHGNALIVAYQTSQPPCLTPPL